MGTHRLDLYSAIASDLLLADRPWYSKMGMGSEEYTNSMSQSKRRFFELTRPFTTSGEALSILQSCYRQ
jgi:hypothetical protein